MPIGAVVLAWPGTVVGAMRRHPWLAAGLGFLAMLAFRLVLGLTGPNGPFLGTWQQSVLWSFTMACAIGAISGGLNRSGRELAPSTAGARDPR